MKHISSVFQHDVIGHKTQAEIQSNVSDICSLA